MEPTYKVFGTLLIGIAILTLQGCTTVQTAGESTSQLAGSIYAPPGWDDDIATKTAGKNFGAPLDDISRGVIYDYLNKINRDYARYITALSSGHAAINVMYDSTNLALTGAAAISNSNPAKTAFAALSTFFQGQKQSMDKNMFDDKAIFALSSIMEIRRGEVLANIRRSLASKEYTLGEGLLDLNEYYRAGTLESALQAAYLNQQPAATASAQASTQKTSTGSGGTSSAGTSQSTAAGSGTQTTTPPNAGSTSTTPQAQTATPSTPAIVPNLVIPNLRIQRQGLPSSTSQIRSE